MAKIRKQIAEAAERARAERDRNPAQAQSTDADCRRPMTGPEVNEWLRGLPHVDPENPEY